MSTLENGSEAALNRLREAQGVLANLLEKDELEETVAYNNLKATEDALRAANPHEDWSHRPTTAPASDSLTPMHPLVGRLNIPDAETAAIEDYGDGIQSTQVEFEIASLDADASNGPDIPFTPPRTVEWRLNSRLHRTWCLKNINLLAPIPTSVWKIWAHMTEVEIKSCEEKAFVSEPLFKDGKIIPNAFPLVLYDQHKCPTLPVLLFLKQDLGTAAPRHPQHSAKLWNCQRPYLRCKCSQNAKSSSCTGKMIWFDHAVWYMLNNLDRFFDSSIYPSLATKFRAFLTWISAATLTAVRAQITFINFWKLMEVAAIEQAAHPNDTLLAKYGDAPGARYVERLFKPTAFTLSATPSPSPAPKRFRKFNMNVTPEETYPLQR